MAKIKSSDTLSLNKSDQKKVVKQTKKLKKKIQDGKITIKRPKRSAAANVEKNRGLMYIGHIPHGFYENEMKKYFKQFGGVTNVKVCRSSKSGNSKGFGYVEFAHPEVAKIAAETMNNYLMFKKRIVAEYVPCEKRPKSLFKGRSSTAKRYSTKVRTEKQRVATNKVDESRHLKRSSARLSRLNKKLQRLKKVGIDYDFTPVDVPEGSKKKEASTKEVSYTFEQDPFDSDIEVKVSNKKSKEDTPKKTPKKVATKRTPKKVATKRAPKQEALKKHEVTENTGKKEATKKTPKKESPKKPVAIQSVKKTTKQTPKQKLVTRKSVQNKLL